MRENQSIKKTQKKGLPKREKRRDSYLARDE